MSGLTKPSPISSTSILAVVMLGLVAASDRGHAQAPPQAQPPQTQAPESPAAPASVQSQPSDAVPAPRENPGLINEIGKLFTAPKWTLPSLPQLKNPFDAIGNSHADQKAGTGGSPRLTTIVKGRTACPVAANGAPDCKSASDKLCQSNGFKEGKSLDTDAAQRCSAKVFIPGRKQEEGDCKTENYVTQALCQ
jgi:hypothetical protein